MAAGDAHELKLQIPSSNFQRSSKLKAPKKLPQSGLMFGHWNFSGAWMLVLGAFGVS
jgi:hypothetical protein